MTLFLVCSRAPRTSFERLAEGERVGGAVWVVLFVALVSGIASYFLGLPFQEALGTAPFAALTPILTAAAGFATPFITWLFYGLLVRIGAGMEAKPWAVAGYGLAPQLGAQRTAPRRNRGLSHRSDAGDGGR